MYYAEATVPTEQNTIRVAVTVASAQTAVLTASGYTVTVTAPCFVVRGANPTAVAQTSFYLAAGIPYKLSGILAGDKLAFITASGTADAYVSPEV